MAGLVGSKGVWDMDSHGKDLQDSTEACISQGVFKDGSLACIVSMW